MGQPLTAVWRNGEFIASYDSFVIGSSVVLRLIFSKIRHFAKPQTVGRKSLRASHEIIKINQRALRKAPARLRSL